MGKDDVAAPRLEVVGDDDYDTLGRPKGALTIAYRTYPSIYGEQSSWVAEYDDLPGYIGEGATIDDALLRLWQDFGLRPHYRVKRTKRSIDEWRYFITRKHQLAAAGATIGAQTRRGSEGVAATAREIGRRKKVVADEAKRFSDAFGWQDDGSYVFGAPEWAASEIRRVAVQKHDIECSVAEATPWRLERAEARAQFPTKNP